MKTDRTGLKVFLLSLFATLLPLWASAQTKVEIDGIWYNLVSKAKQAEVTFKGDSYDSYNEYSGSITVPATVTYEGVNYSVTSIGNYAFRDCRSLTAIILPESVTSIGNDAFRRCDITSITLPESVTSIGSYAFEACGKLISIILPEGITSIGHYAFRDCRSLTAIILPEGVTSIGNHAFQSCSSLTSVTIPENSQLTSTGEYTFSGCKSLTSITLPNGVTSIGRSAFSSCSSLTAITISESVTSIGDGAFSSCSSLTAITIPEGVTSIEEYAFAGCSSLTAITLPEGVTSILNNAFYGCTNLKVVNIPNGLTRLSDAAFDGCSSLTSIVLPKSVKYIYGKAFANCSELTDVYCYAETLPSTDANAFDGSYVEYATLHVPANALDTYKTTAPWNNFGTIVAIEGEQPDEPTEEGWSEWEALGTAVTIRGKEAMMTSLQYWGEGEIAPWEEPITIDQRYDRADPTKKQLRLNGIFNAKEIVLDYDSSTGKISAEQQSTGYATNKTMIEGQGVSNPYDEFIFSLSTATYRSATGVIDMSNAFFYINELLGFSMGFTLQIEGVTPPTFTGQWDRKYVGREGGEATFTLTFEEPIVKYRALVLAPGESLTVSAVSALYAAKPETDLKYEETDSPTFAIACDKMGTYRVVFVPIGADGTAVLDYQLTSIVSYAEPAYETYEWEYIGESTVSEHVGSLLISNDELWEEGEDGWVNRYPFMTTSEGVKTYRRADNPNIIGLCNLYGENHPYSSMFTYVDQTQDWWVYIDVTNPKDVKLLTTPVGAVSTQVGYATFITQYSDAGAATLSDGVVTFPRGSVLLNNVLNQDMQAAFDFKVILPTEEEPGNMVNQIELNQTSTTLIEGETMILTATVTPDDADDTSVTWNSSDEAVATVDAQGKVTAVASGFAIITATANDGSGVCASCDVTVLGIFSITYLLDGEVYYYDELVQGTKIVLPKEPVKEGYTFSGWSEVPETMPGEDVIVEGTFAINKYLVTFRIGDEVIAADSLEYGAVIVVPDAPAKEGYTFSGWGEVPETMPAEDVIVEGTFAINKYLVTFRIGGEVVAADSLEYGAVIVVPDAPAKEGYTFNGWGEVPETMPAEDVIVEGTYTVNVYKVYYYVGEELVHTDEVAYGEVIPEYVYEPTAEGDVFMGWLGETYETMPAHDVTYTANIESSIHHSILNAHDAVIYDLSGRRVLNVENLTGVYIINGKRVLIK